MITICLILWLRDGGSCLPYHCHRNAAALDVLDEVDSWSLFNPGYWPHWDAISCSKPSSIYIGVTQVAPSKTDSCRVGWEWQSPLDGCSSHEELECYWALFFVFCLSFHHFSQRHVAKTSSSSLSFALSPFSLPQLQVSSLFFFSDIYPQGVIWIFKKWNIHKAEACRNKPLLSWISQKTCFCVSF